jgi:cell division protein FtsI (penicillin-binding protein 3)
MRAGGPDAHARGIRLRIGAVAIALAAGFALVAGRAVQLQVLRRGELSALAEGQHDRSVEVKSRRGSITDRSGVPLAADAEVDSVFVDPKVFPEKGRREAAARLAKALEVDVRAIEKRLGQEGLRFAWVKRRISPAESAAVRTLQLPGVGFVKEFRRYYPSRDLAGQLLGVVAENGAGQEGIERLWDAELRGASIRLDALRDARGMFSLRAPTVSGQALAGARVELAIDQPLQLVAEQALARAVEKARAQAGMLVAIDPATGDVVALANAPLFNPNTTRREAAKMRNRAVLDTFEPGSTMKTFTLAAALEAGTLRPDEGVDCEQGRLRIGRHVVNDHHAYGWIGAAKVLAVSSNVGSAKIGQRLGRERLRDGLRAFGFGERPGTGLAGEPRGVIPLPRSDISLATMSFGQGLTATPLQITAAMAAVANGGLLMKPVLVKRVVDVEAAPGGALAEQVVFAARAEPVRQVVSRRTADVMRRWLEGVIHGEDGTGKRARLNGWRAGGKTGTAQKADPVTGGYGDKRFSSFVGFAPVDAPRIVIGVFLDEPKGEVYGGEIAAPVFREVAEWAMQSYGVPPTEPVVAEKVAGERAAEPARPARAEAPAPPALEIAPARVLAPGSVEVPPLQGLAARSAVRTLEERDLLVEVAGTGRVVSQAPRPGEVVPKGSTVRVTLAPPG